MKLGRFGLVGLACCSAVFTAGALYGQAADHAQERDIAPSGRGIGTRYEHGPSSHRFGPERMSRQKRAIGNGIYYHGGPLLGTAVPPNVYLIWYGNWSGNTAISILTNLASHIGGSSYFNINTTYYNGSGDHVLNAVSYKGSTTDNYSQGTSLSDSAVQLVVQEAISSGRLALDPDGVYFVLTSKDVNEKSGSAATTAAGTRTEASAAPTSSTLSSATRTAALPRAKSRRYLPTTTRARTGWLRLLRMNWRRRSQIPFLTRGMTIAARRTPTSAPGPSARLRRPATDRATTSH